MTILLFLAVLSVLVFVHELGHFLVAKKTGMAVEEFGFGFPPRAFGVKRGDTTYSVNWIPLGGFVKIKGESGEFRDDADSFSSQAGWKRFAVLFAGVAMNMLLAAVLLSIGFMLGLPSVIDAGTPKSAHISDQALVATSIVPDSPSAKAGLKAGDTILTIDTRVFENADAARNYIRENGDGGMDVGVQHEDGTFGTSRVASADIPSAGIHGIGVGLVMTGRISYAPPMAVYHGFVMAGALLADVVLSFYDLLKNIIVHQKVGVELSGPVGIAVMTGEVARLGFVYLLQFTALLSVNLAVVNVLPFPALDGGRIFFLAIEKLRRRAMNQRAEALMHNIGFLLLISLVLLVTYRDFVRFGGSMWHAIQSFVGA